MRGLLLVALTLLLAPFAQAYTLSPLGDPPHVALNIDPNAANLPCDKIVEALGNFNTMFTRNNDATLSFLDQLVLKLTEWHGQLLPLEATAQSIPVGTFTVLQDGANKIDQLRAVASDNVTLLATELARIQDSLAACQISARIP